MAQKKKIRVHELSKQLNITNDQLLEFLKQEGIEAKSHSSTIDEETADLITQLVEEQDGDDADEEIEEAAPLLVVDEDEEEASLPYKAQKIIKNTERDKRKNSSKKRSSNEELDNKVKPKESSGNAREIIIKPPIIVKDLATELGVKPNVVIMELMGKGIMANINQAIEIDAAEDICSKRGYKLVAEKRVRGSAGTEKPEGEEIAPEDRVFEDAEVEPRPPVVAFLGHVDHGKTSLQDKLRDTNVADGEAGAITQHVGASTIDWQGHKVTFIDTPGHEAFTAMRARGANVTDIVILVVAADDGFMPQTREALDHAKAAGVSIIIAMNKIDLATADPDKVLRQMMESELMPEEWGGECAAIRTSATTGEGLNDLMERIVLETEMLELKANSKLPGQAIVLESELEQGLGATANILIKNGTIEHGDIVICDQYYGKVKALIDSKGNRLKKAGPSTPVKLVGLNGVPNCGDKLVVCEDEKRARDLADERGVDARHENLKPQMAASLDDLLAQMDDEKRTNLKVILKTDVQGTCEAVSQSLKKLESPKIALDIVHKGVGSITENDVLLASASGAIIVGFHVRVNPGVNKTAQKEGVEIHLYSIIYELIDKIKASMEGRLEPEYKERPIGQAEILQIFTLTKRGKICGSTVKEGAVRINAKARVFRDDDLIYNGDIVSLKRFQDNVSEVKAGLECGIKLDNFLDFEIGDRIEVYEVDEIQAKL